MSFSAFFVNFLQPVAVGTGTVLAVFLLVWIRTPRRSAIAVSSRHKGD
jgi:hypothetical protein